MYPLDGKFYSAYLREKSGELRALGLLDDVSADCLIPILVALPLSEKENANLSVLDVIKREIGRVQRSWGGRICLWDPQYLIFNDHDAEEDTVRLRDVLDRFLTFGAKVIPVVALREGFHRASTIGAYATRTNGGAAIRIEFDDIQEYELLEAQRATLKLPASECLLVVDISTADVTEHDEFAKSLIGWLFALRQQGDWAKIILTASSYPRKNPAPPLGQVLAPRPEWKLWEWAVGLEPSLKDFVIFGDYGADSAHFDFRGGGRPIPHLRYLRTIDWQIVRGDKTYKSLRDVAKRIAASLGFMGRDFSAGDEFISDCAKGAVGTADPTQWRAVNMNHHLTTAVRQLATLYKVILVPRKATRPEQATLFAE